jgi:hypothetical protein
MLTRGQVGRGFIGSIAGVFEAPWCGRGIGMVKPGLPVSLFHSIGPNLILNSGSVFEEVVIITQFEWPLSAKSGHQYWTNVLIKADVQRRVSAAGLQRAVDSEQNEPALAGDGLLPVRFLALRPLNLLKLKKPCNNNLLKLPSLKGLLILLNLVDELSSIVAILALTDLFTRAVVAH